MTTTSRVLVVVAVLLGLFTGYVDLHNNEVQAPLLMLLLSTIVLGIIQPRKAWLWALLVGMWIPLGPVLALVVGGINTNYPDPLRTTISLLPVFIPAFMGAYFGAMLSRGFREPRKPPANA